MEAMTRVSVYYPTGTLTVFWVLANIVMNNQQYCTQDQQRLMVVLIVVLSIICFALSFTDTYTAR